MAKRTPMMDQYLEIKQTCPDALLFFRLGDFYELFFDDAKTASGLLELTLTGRGAGDSRAPMCGVPYHAVDSYIARLIGLGFKIAICEQVEDPKVAKGLVRRKVTRIVTPGTSHDYFPDGDARRYLATAAERPSGEFEAAVLDAMTGDNWARTGSPETLASWLLSLDVAEIVIPVGLSPRAGELLREIAKRAKIAVSEFACADEGAAALAAYAANVGRRVLNHIKAVEWIEETRYMSLSASAYAHLELLAPLVAGRKRATLFETVDRTRCAMGKRRLRAMIERPFAAREPILRRQESVARFVADTLFGAKLQEELRGIFDLARIAARLSFSAIAPREMAALAHVLERVARIKTTLQEHGALCEDLEAIKTRLHELEDVRRATQELLQDEAPVSAKDGGIIRAGVDPNLDRLRDLAKGGRAFVAELERRERARTGIKSLKVGYNRVFGYYIEVTAANARLVPDDFQRKQTLAGTERYTTEELQRAERDIVEADERAKALEEEHFLRLAASARERVPLLQETEAALGELDALLSLAEVAREGRYVRPEVDESLEFHIEKGRHPVVEWAVGGDFVPNSVRLSGAERQIALITGPNMAGKSTYMRQVALIAILAQIGGFVPAESARIGLVDKIFTRIGAADDLSAGLSTFMVEMKETAEVLASATARSLILLDEIGRGTATYDGLSIAEAVVEHIHDQVFARTLFATHYHELTRLPARFPRTFNLSVAVAEKGDGVVFLHQIVERPADRSYGIHVARLAGLPRSVTERAREILRGLEAQGTERGDPDARYLQLEAVLDEAAAADATAWLREELDELSLDDFTPREALIYLFDLQRRVRERE